MPSDRSRCGTKSSHGTLEHSVDPTDPAQLRRVGAGLDRSRPLVFHQSEVTAAAA